MIAQTQTNDTLPRPADEALADELGAWVILRLAASVRRARTRRELFRVSERDLNDMGLTRFDVGH